MAVSRAVAVVWLVAFNCLTLVADVEGRSRSIPKVADGDSSSSSWADAPPVKKAAGSKKSVAAEANRPKDEHRNLTATTELKNDELTCSRCLWAGKALRAAVKDKIPKRMKDRDQRRSMAEEALEAHGKAAVCHERRCLPRRQATLSEVQLLAFVVLARTNRCVLLKQ
eukprot:TRINITY_DN32838_c0_g1_i3.p1 TRINITY_DN32838_c0_g1~~TRINITY_DN32838_c0_g1_i3.p1  ORF type:complete len:191 (-),score=24.02 TRINITY_DN32838_c0_g1_i3:355-858(-)